MPGREDKGGVGLARGMSKLKSENNFLVKGEEGRGELGKFDSRG